MSEFKVGDKVCDPVRGLNGVVNSVSEPGYYPVKVDFECGDDDAYTSDGKVYDANLLPSLFLGHMEPGTGKVTFTPKKEPVYEWQWLKVFDSSGIFDTTGHFESEEELSACIPIGWKIHSRIEESKREVKP